MLLMYMSPRSIRPLTWSGWCLTSWLRKGAASKGLRSSVSRSAKLNRAERKSSLSSMACVETVILFHWKVCVGIYVNYCVVKVLIYLTLLKS